MFLFEYVGQVYVFTVRYGKLMARSQNSWYTATVNVEIKFCPDNAESSILFYFPFFTSDNGVRTSYYVCVSWGKKFGKIFGENFTPRTK